MPLPFYSGDKQRTQGDYSYLLFVEDIKQNLNHIPSKDVGSIHPLFMKNLANYYQAASNAIYLYPNGLRNWKRTAEIYFELVKLAAELGAIEPMTQIYHKSAMKINEGQESLHHLEQQLNAIKDSDWRVKFRALLEKYHQLFEGTIRFSLVLAVFSLDLITEHEDSARTSIDRYIKDDVAHHFRKINESQDFEFQNDLTYLVKGIEPNVRHAIAHRNVEFGDEYNVILTNRDWRAEFKIGEFERLVETAYINFLGQVTAQLLFAYEYNERMDFTNLKMYSSTKQLRILIDQQINESYLVSNDIVFKKNETCLICKVQKRPGFDAPEEIISKRLFLERPALDLEEQIVKAVYKIAGLNTDFEHCTFIVVDHKGDESGSITFDLKDAYQLVFDDDGWNKLRSHIIDNSLGTVTKE